MNGIITYPHGYNTDNTNCTNHTDHTPTSTGQWPFADIYELFTTTFQEASYRATQQQRPILASITVGVAWWPTVQAFAGFRQAALGECFFWEQAAERHALVGTGTSATIETRGADRFTDAAAAWRDLLADAVITCAPKTQPMHGNGPLLFGGFAFDPLAPRTPLWQNFPDGQLILPRFLLSYEAETVTFTINTMVSAQDNFEQQAHAIEDELFQLHMAIEGSAAHAGEEASHAITLRDIRPASAWMNSIANSVAMIRQGAFDKVVLARSVEATLNEADATFDIEGVLQRLRESYPTAFVFAIQRGEQWFMGATPERLVQAQGGQIHTMALAGSARRGATRTEDDALGAELLESKKNNSEHAIVATMVRDALSQHCTNVHISAAPQLLKLKNVQHLMTPILGELRAGRCILDVMADLHPTPAVGGFPRDAALAAIRDNEQLDRGWYAGPIGWIGGCDAGEFAVALRSGLVNGNCATLFAGCGIVADSDPQTEYAESCLKLQAMLRGLGANDSIR